MEELDMEELKTGCLDMKEYVSWGILTTMMLTRIISLVIFKVNVFQTKSKIIF